MRLIKLFQLFIKRLKFDIIQYCYAYIYIYRSKTNFPPNDWHAAPLSESRTRRRANSVLYMQIIRVMKYFQVPYSSYNHIQNFYQKLFNIYTYNAYTIIIFLTHELHVSSHCSCYRGYANLPIKFSIR